MRWTAISGIILAIIFGICLGLARHEYSSYTFAGSAFHGGPADCVKVYSGFKSFLEAEGFHLSSSPAPMDAWAGVHSEDSRRDWYSKTGDGNSTTFVYVDVYDRALHTSIKWGARGFKSARREAERKGLQFALRVDDWFALVPESNLLPESMRKKKRQWFSERLTAIDND